MITTVWGKTNRQSQLLSITNQMFLMSLPIEFNGAIFIVWQAQILCHFLQELTHSSLYDITTAATYSQYTIWQSTSKNCKLLKLIL